jgi:hypothetical protein
MLAKGLREITRTEWIKYRWIDVTEMGDEDRMLTQGPPRTPDEMVQAMNDWEETEEFREVIQ